MISHSQHLFRPTWAEISLENLKRNLNRVRRLAGPHRRVLAVSKADAYGHGAVPISRALAAADTGVDWFGVATAEEALELRQNGIRQPILLLGGLYMSEPALLVEHDLTPSVSSTARLDTYAACARRMGKPVGFHLKVDTGMGRLGLPLNRLRVFLDHYRQLEGITLTGVFTHLASAEDPGGAQTREQLERFRNMMEFLKSEGITPESVHISNSAALASQLPIEENMVRVGALLFGFCPPFSSSVDRMPAAAREFEPLMELKSTVVFLKDVPAGTPLGYGGTFRTERPSRIATVPIGYADGISRRLSNRGRAIVRDHSAPIVGAISMDLTLLDVSEVPGVKVGEEVLFIGKGPQASITALEISEQLDTVPYEILCSIGKRVPRVYV